MWLLVENTGDNSGHVGPSGGLALKLTRTSGGERVKAGNWIHPKVQQLYLNGWSQLLFWAAITPALNLFSATTGFSMCFLSRYRPAIRLVKKLTAQHCASQRGKAHKNTR